MPDLLEEAKRLSESEWLDPVAAKRVLVALVERESQLQMLVALYEQPPSMSEGEHNDWLLQVEELREKVAAQQRGVEGG